MARSVGRTYIWLAGAVSLVIVSAGAGADAAKEEGKGDREAAPVLRFKVKDIDGKDVELSTYQGNVLMVVNVASRCGLTDRQYKNIQALYEKYQERGFKVLAFPANSFLGQEPGDNAQIKSFCEMKKVTFPLFGKISVKGPDMHPLYKFLTSKETNPGFGGEIRWNFDKFLIDRKGQIVGRFEPKADPLDKKVTDLIEKKLAERPEENERTGS